MSISNLTNPNNYNLYANNLQLDNVLSVDGIGLANGNELAITAIIAEPEESADIAIVAQNTAEVPTLNSAASVTIQAIGASPGKGAIVINADTVNMTSSTTDPTFESNLRLIAQNVAGTSAATSNAKITINAIGKEPAGKGYVIIDGDDLAIKADSIVLGDGTPTQVLGFYGTVTPTSIITVQQPDSVPDLTSVNNSVRALLSALGQTRLNLINVTGA